MHLQSHGRPAGSGGGCEIDAFRVKMTRLPVISWGQVSRRPCDLSTWLRGKTAGSPGASAGPLSGTWTRVGIPSCSKGSAPPRVLPALPPQHPGARRSPTGGAECGPSRRPHSIDPGPRPAIRPHRPAGEPIPHRGRHSTPTTNRPPRASRGPASADVRLRSRGRTAAAHAAPRPRARSGEPGSGASHQPLRRVGQRSWMTVTRSPAA